MHTLMSMKGSIQQKNNRFVNYQRFIEFHHLCSSHCIFARRFNMVLTQTAARKYRSKPFRKNDCLQSTIISIDTRTSQSTFILKTQPKKYQIKNSKQCSCPHSLPPKLNYHKPWSATLMLIDNVNCSDQHRKFAGNTRLVCLSIYLPPQTSLR